MLDGRNEVSFYVEIEEFIEAQLKSNFLAKQQRELEVFWGLGELKANLNNIISSNPEKCACAKRYAESVPMLNVDISALVTDGIKYELIILEVKLMNSVGLKEWSQLVGYCLVSGAKYGLLINIDNGASPRLSQILSNEEHISHIQELVNDKKQEHFLGFMEWDALTHSFNYSNLGCIRSISDLSNRIIDDFSNYK